ncbi:MAG TPA: hypothetical protein VFY78_12050 [Gammaproteobacteria bacterium]|nr:hypothetical protein [Gammaproteobacteria bacterium]
MRGAFCALFDFTASLCRLNAKICVHLTLVAAMFSTELFIVSALKAVVEVAGMALLGQGLIGLLAGKAKQGNFVYRIFLVITTPIYRLARALSPRFIADAHMGLASFFIVFWLWVGLVYAKGYVCHVQNLACGAG